MEPSLRLLLTATHAAWHELQLSIDGEAQSLGSDLSEDVHDLHARLVRAEQRYGGYVEVKRNKISAKDVRVRDGNVAATLEALNARSPMVGGDRMSTVRHGYGALRHGSPKGRRYQASATVVEVGILRGPTGHLVRVVPERRVGLDIDLSYAAENLSFSRKRVRLPQGTLNSTSSTRRPDPPRLAEVQGLSIDVSSMTDRARSRRLSAR